MQLNQMRSALSRFRESLELNDRAGSARSDEEFHRIIADAAQNRMLQTLLSQIREQVFRYRLESLKAESAHKELVRQHEQILTSLEGETRTMVFYESPYRLVKTLEQMIEHFGPERRCSVAREISKLHEEHKRGTLQEVAAWFREHEPKGEIVLVVAGAEPVKPVKQKRYGRGEETEDTEETDR